MHGYSMEATYLNSGFSHVLWPMVLLDSRLVDLGRGLDAEVPAQRVI